MPSPAPANFDGRDVAQVIEGTLSVLDTSGTGAYGTVTAQGVNLANGDPTPADIGDVAWTFDPSGMTGTKLLTAGTVYLMGFWLRSAVLVSALGQILRYTVTTGATGATAGQNFVGVYNGVALANRVAGTRIAVSADQSANFGSTGTFSPALTYLAVTDLLLPGLYWAAVVANAATTLPTLRASGGDIAAINGNGSGATLRCAVNGTGQTSLPASITPSANSAVNASPLYFGFR
jgi:hypothetical protein